MPKPVRLLLLAAIAALTGSALLAPAGYASSDGRIHKVVITPTEAAAIRAVEAGRATRKSWTAMTSASLVGATSLDASQATDNTVNEVTPSQASVAAGPSSLVELSNSRIARITGLIGGGNTEYSLHLSGDIGLDSFVGLAPGTVGPNNVRSPQVIYSPAEGRFYYSAVYTDPNAGGTGVAGTAVAFGWSRNNDPSVAAGSADWCQYIIASDSAAGPTGFDDNVKLGHYAGWLVLTANNYTSAASTEFNNARIYTIRKPTSADPCATAATLNQPANFKTHNLGTVPTTTRKVYSPVPAIHTDAVPPAQGHVLAVDGIGAVTGNRSTLTYWILDAAGDPVGGTAGANINVPAYRSPPNAEQPDSVFDVFTGSGDLTTAVGRTDTTKGVLNVWVAHAINNSNSNASAARYYKVGFDGTPDDDFNGTITETNVDWFNPVISPAGDGAKGVLMVNRSANPTGAANLISTRIRTVAATGVPTLEATAMTSVAPSQDFSCEGSNVCDWNLSASMVPDPSNAAVWGVATFVGPAAGTAPHWRTRVFSATP